MFDIAVKAARKAFEEGPWRKIPVPNALVALQIGG